MEQIRELHALERGKPKPWVGGKPSAESEQDKELRAKLRPVFNKFDADRSGAVSIGEMTKMAKAIGVQLTPAQLKQMMAEADPNGSGEVDFEEVSSLCTARVQPVGGSVCDTPGGSARCARERCERCLHVPLTPLTLTFYFASRLSPLASSPARTHSSCRRSRSKWRREAPVAWRPSSLRPRHSLAGYQTR